MIQHLTVGALCAVAVGYSEVSIGLHPRLQFVVVFLLSAILSGVIGQIYYYWSWARKEKAAGCLPPVVRAHRLPGSIDAIRRMQKADQINEVPNEFQRIYNEMGGAHTWRQAFFGKVQIFTTDPKNIQALLATQFNDFAIGELRRKSFFPLLGNGIFTTDGKAWEHSRAMLRPQFTRDQVADLDLEEIHVQHMLKHMPVNSQGWTSELDLSPLFFRLTLDSATEFLFGHSVESQVAALPDGAPEKVELARKGHMEWTTIATSFDSAMHHLGSRGRLNQLYWLHHPKEFSDQCQDVHRFADFYVNRALKEAASQQPRSEKDDGKGRYIFLNELVRQTQDPIELRSQLLNILLAGRDTTAGLLGWSFWLLVRHPAALEKLQKAIADDFGTYENPRNITFAGLKNCTYLQYVLNETLRLYPSVPLNARRSTRDTTIPRGGGPDGMSPVFVAKGHEVAYCPHVMQRRKDIWGPDADEFRPERWVGRKGGWEYIPFNGGPRVCLGQQFALTEAGYVVVRLLQRFDAVENADPNNIPKHQYSVTTAPVSVRVRLHQQAKSS